MGSVAVESLAPAEVSRLAELETIITKGLRTFVDVGTALREIRDSGLYRAEHATFADYCQVRWGYGRSQAYNLMDAAEIARDVQLLDKPGPSLTQALALKPLPPAERQAVAATTDFATTTSAQVRDIVAEREPKFCATCGVDVTVADRYALDGTAFQCIPCGTAALQAKHPGYDDSPEAWANVAAFDVRNYPDLVFAPVPVAPKDAGFAAWFEATVTESLGRFDPSWLDDPDGLAATLDGAIEAGWWNDNGTEFAALGRFIVALADVCDALPTATGTDGAGEGEG